MESKIVGKLQSDEFDSGLYESEPFEFPYFDKAKLKGGISNPEQLNLSLDCVFRSNLFSSFY